MLFYFCNLVESQQDDRIDKLRLKSDNSIVTLEETILINQKLKSLSISPQTSTSTPYNDDVPNLITVNTTNNTTNTNNNKQRRHSSKSSLKKRVNLSETNEIIQNDLSSINDDDEVFSDSIPSKLPRGDMCTPYPQKRGSMPGLFALPDWFESEDRYFLRDFEK